MKDFVPRVSPREHPFLRRGGFLCGVARKSKFECLRAVSLPIRQCDATWPALSTFGPKRQSSWIPMRSTPPTDKLKRMAACPGSNARTSSYTQRSQSANMADVVDIFVSVLILWTLMTSKPPIDLCRNGRLACPRANARMQRSGVELL